MKYIICCVLFFHVMYVFAEETEPLYKRTLNGDTEAMYALGYDYKPVGGINLS